MINTNTHDYMSVLPPRDADESAVLKVRRTNVHLKGQGKMQVPMMASAKNSYKRNALIRLRSETFEEFREG